MVHKLATTITIINAINTCGNFSQKNEIKLNWSWWEENDYYGNKDISEISVLIYELNFIFKPESKRQLSKAKQILQITKMEKELALNYIPKEWSQEMIKKGIYYKGTLIKTYQIIRSLLPFHSPFFCWQFSFSSFLKGF